MEKAQYVSLGYTLKITKQELCFKILLEGRKLQSSLTSNNQEAYATQHFLK